MEKNKILETLNEKLEQIKLDGINQLKEHNEYVK